MRRLFNTSGSPKSNIDSFHFHGSQDDFPASAVIVVPKDTRSSTILKGRYLDSELPTQLIEPAGVIQGLVDRIFRIKSLLDVVTAIIAVAAVAAVGLAVFLSYRLRAREIATAVKLGAQRGMVLTPLGSGNGYAIVIRRMYCCNWRGYCVAQR